MLRHSSAFVALSALVALGIVGDPASSIEFIIEQVVDGALDGLMGDNEDLARAISVKRLVRALLDVEAATRGIGGLFEQFVPHLMKQVHAPLKSLCRVTEEDIRLGGGIRTFQLKNIAEWAFSETNPHTLVLGHGNEILGAVLPAVCMKDARMAVVDCSQGSVKTWGEPGGIPINRATHGVVAYMKGSAQDATHILLRNNWLQPYTPPPPPPRLAVNATMSMFCEANKALTLCCSFLQSVGIQENDAIVLIEAIKKEVVAQFARDVRIVAKEMPSWGDTKPIDVEYSFFYENHSESRDWKKWFGVSPEDVKTIIINQSSISKAVQLGDHTFYGFTGKALDQSPLIAMHSAQMDSSSRAGTITTSSMVSTAVAEVAGFIYTLGLSIVHVPHDIKLRIRTSLGSGYRFAYKALMVKPHDPRFLPRQVCLGALAALWLGLPTLWVPDWPHTAIGISNSRGSVLSAIVAETSSLKEATTIFIVDTDVPELMVAERPVVACAGYKQGRVIGGYEVDLEPTDPKGFYDGCNDMSCLTVCVGQPPQLSKSMVSSVLAVSVVGYVACGTAWSRYVDLDDAFVVMANSESQPDCKDCPPNFRGRWLKDAREFLHPEGKHRGFTCSCCKKGEKLMIPAHGNGLKQSFLCGLFRESSQNLRYREFSCVAHALGDVIIT